MSEDEGLVDVGRVLDLVDGMLDDVDQFDDQAVTGVKEMISGGLKLADSLADDTILDKAVDVDGEDKEE